MTGFDSPVFKQVATMKDVVAQLQAKLPTSVAAQGGTQALAQASAQGLPSSGSANPAPASGQTSALTSGQSSSFQQDTTETNISVTNSSLGTIANSGSGAGGFQQDAGSGPVAGGYMDSCCGPLIQQLETTASTFATNVPVFSQRFRNVNLILEGLNLVNNMVNQANTLKQSIRALRQAKNAQGAAFALTAVQTQVNGISSSGGFVQDTSLPSQP